MIAKWLIASYFSGCLLFGLWLPQLFNRGNPRQTGSGNIGATNVGRMAGPFWAFLIFFLDMLKAYIPCTIFLYLNPKDFEGALMLGFMVMLGHIFPITGKFKGGKGVSCFFGTLLALSWPVCLGAGVIWGLVWKKTEYASIASLVSISMACFWLTFYVSFLALACLALIFWAHLPNLKRLIKGTETR